MRRRTFLFAAAATLAVHGTGPARRPIRFWLAGVRFVKTDDWPESGNTVVLRPETWNGNRAMAVFFGSTRIGYVPRRRLQSLGNSTRGARVVRANPDAVPWKRYLIEAA